MDKPEGSNMVNPEDSLKYLSNLFVRKRFIGGANGVSFIDIDYDGNLDIYAC